MRERWKKHPVHDVEVSNLGRVRRNGRIKKLSPRKDGYLVTSVGGRGAPIRRVNRLVLETFRGIRCNSECRHTPNNDPADNRLANLKWGNRTDQIADQRDVGTFSPPPHYKGAMNPAYRWGPGVYREAFKLLRGGVPSREVSRIVGISKSQLLRRWRAMETTV